jgi:hypothetical protein
MFAASLLISPAIAYLESLISPSLLLLSILLTSIEVSEGLVIVVIGRVEAFSKSYFALFGSVKISHSFLASSLLKKIYCPPETSSYLMKGFSKWAYINSLIAFPPTGNP